MIYKLLTAAAFATAFMFLLIGKAPAQTTDFLDHPTDTHIDINTGDNATFPRDSVTTCSGGMCVNRSIKPDPTNCPAGQVLITLFRYGNRSTVCVPE